MNRHRSNPSLGPSLVGVAWVCLGAIVVFTARSSPVRADSGWTYPDPLYTPSDAIARSLQDFPPGHEPHSEVARLVSVATLEDWSGGGRSGWPPTTAAWLVAVLGESLTAQDVEPLFGRADPVEGAYYAWDANSGVQVAGGLLGGRYPATYVSIVALRSESLAIHPATQVPTIEATARPTPTAWINATPAPPGVLPAPHSRRSTLR